MYGRLMVLETKLVAEYPAEDISRSLFTNGILLENRIRKSFKPFIMKISNRIFTTEPRPLNKLDNNC